VSATSFSDDAINADKTNKYSVVFYPKSTDTAAGGAFHREK